METSLQAQFLIPLAVSIGYGVLIGTLVIVFTVPSVFMAQHHVGSLIMGTLRLFAREEQKTQAPEDVQNSDEKDDDVVRFLAAE
jgi:uncharacterized transporter YbjL